MATATRKKKLTAPTVSSSTASSASSSNDRQSSDVSSSQIRSTGRRKREVKQEKTTSSEDSQEEDRVESEKENDESDQDASESASSASAARKRRKLDSVANDESSSHSIASASAASPDPPALASTAAAANPAAARSSLLPLSALLPPTLTVASMCDDAISLTKSLGLWSRSVAQPIWLDGSVSRRRKAAAGGRRSQRNQNSPDDDQEELDNAADDTRSTSTRQTEKEKKRLYAHLPIHSHQLQMALGFESDVSLSDEDPDSLLMPPPRSLPPVVSGSKRSGMMMRGYGSTQVILSESGLTPLKIPSREQRKQEDHGVALDDPMQIDEPTAAVASPSAPISDSPAALALRTDDILAQLHEHKQHLTRSLKKNARASSDSTSSPQQRITPSLLAASAMKHFQQMRAQYATQKTSGSSTQPRLITAPSWPPAIVSSAPSAAASAAPSPRTANNQSSPSPADNKQRSTSSSSSSSSSDSEEQQKPSAEESDQSDDESDE